MKSIPGIILSECFVLQIDTDRVITCIPAYPRERLTRLWSKLHNRDYIELYTHNTMQDIKRGA